MLYKDFSQRINICQMPYKLKDPVRHKFNKKSYNVRDWKKYDENLRNRGSLTIWFSEELHGILFDRPK
jgi:hypothetical protein